MQLVPSVDPLHRFVAAALFALGLSLVAQKLGGDAIEAAWLVALKLIVHPLMTWALVTWVFEMPPLWSKAAVILAALPVGALVFVIAQQYDVYVRRASTAIVASTANPLPRRMAMASIGRGWPPMRVGISSPISICHRARPVR